MLSAFSAYFDEDLYISTPGTVVFDTKREEYGSGYDGITGVYSCNKHGMYRFSATIQTTVHFQCHSRLQTCSLILYRIKY